MQRKRRLLTAWMITVSAWTLPLGTASGSWLIEPPPLLDPWRPPSPRSRNPLLPLRPPAGALGSPVERCAQAIAPLASERHLERRAALDLSRAACNRIARDQPELFRALVLRELETQGLHLAF